MCKPIYNFLSLLSSYVARTIYRRHSLITTLGGDRPLINQQILLQHFLGKRLQHRLQLLGLGSQLRIGKYADICIAVLVGIVRYGNNQGMMVVARALGHAKVDARSDVDDEMILAGRRRQAKPATLPGVDLESMALRRPGTTVVAAPGRLGRGTPVQKRSS